MRFVRILCVGFYADGLDSRLPSVSFLHCSLHLREQCMGFVIALRSGGEMQSPSFLLTETRQVTPCPQ